MLSIYPLHCTTWSAILELLNYEEDNDLDELSAMMKAFPRYFPALEIIALKTDFIKEQNLGRVHWGSDSNERLGILIQGGLIDLPGSLWYGRHYCHICFAVSLCVAAIA
jgi:hypothetical protein